MQAFHSSEHSQRPDDRLVYFAVLLLFFFSGFAALLYQVVWQRTLAYFSGADVYSVTIIVSAFMGGLGCGSIVGGHLADRLSPRSRVRAFAFSEAAIAVFALISLVLYHDILYFRLPQLARSSTLLPIVLFIVLLWPTFFMGMSLPLLARAVTRRVEESSRRIGGLYAINTLGAAVGAFATTWVITRHLGFGATVLLGAALNSVAAVCAVALTSRLAGEPKIDINGDSSFAEPTSILDSSPEELRSRTRWVGWVAVYSLSGFIALSLEILWFRLLGVIAKPTAFSFGNLLGVFLSGLACGTFIGIRAARRSRNPQRAFLACQIGVCAYCGLSIALFTTFLPHSEGLQSLWNYLGQYEPLDIKAVFSAMDAFVRGESVSPVQVSLLKRFVVLYGVVPVAIVGPPTVMMGASFPFLQKVVQRELSELGRRVGWLQTGNIAGSMLGAILTGVFLLGSIGTSATLRLLVLAAIAFFGLLKLSRRRSRWVALSALIGLGFIALAIPSNADLWSRLHGSSPDQTIVEEDASGLSLLKAESPGLKGEVTVYVNGLGQSEIPFSRWHIALGMIPVLLHQDPESVALIGLGSGATLYGAGGRQETRKLTSIEIVAPQLTTLRQLQSMRADSGLAQVLADDRITHYVADGRRFLFQGSDRYDVIEADALRPTSAYAGNLYSTEYFQLLRSRLKLGGFAVSWAPTDRIVETFVKVFPYVLWYSDPNIRLVIGSNTQFSWDPAVIQKRLNSPFTTRHYQRGGLNLAFYAEAIAKSRRAWFTPGFDRSQLNDINGDLFPRDEFLVRRRIPSLDLTIPQAGLMLETKGH